MHAELSAVCANFANLRRPFYLFKSQRADFSRKDLLGFLGRLHCALRQLQVYGHAACVHPLV